MEFEIFDLGLVDFKTAEQFQKKIFTSVKVGLIKSALILCQHLPVITLGRLANKKNILLSECALKARDIKIYKTERGGDVTYHGPGQIIAYPIFNLHYFKKDIRLFLRYLEDVSISLLWDFKIKGLRFPGLTGIWINSRLNKQKISSIGIAIRNWIAFHGLSINIKKNDLGNFRLIRPCGMDIEMTSLETVINKEVNIDNTKEILINKFRRNI